MLTCCVLCFLSIICGLIKNTNIFGRVELLVENLPEKGDRVEVLGPVEVRADVADEALKELHVVLRAGLSLGVDDGFEALLEEFRQGADVSLGQHFCELCEGFHLILLDELVLKDVLVQLADLLLKI